MERRPEPELMDEAGQALAYAAADFAEPHQAFVAHFRRRFPAHAPRAVLDLGCGAADVTLRFARAYPDCRITAVDGAPAMLAHARAAVAGAGLGARIRLVHARLPGFAPRTRFDTVLSNSLLHHLHAPAVLWQAITGCTAPGAAVFVVDLRRPPSPARARALVARYAAGEPEILRRDFHNSLRAAFEPAEVRAQLAAAGLALSVEVLGDRHLAVSGRL
jgi:SAM-dependent methyltransferase